MNSASAADSVLSILKERDIIAKRDVIQSALDESSAGLENLEWVSKHLRPETLLSKEELALCVNASLVMVESQDANCRV